MRSGELAISYLGVSTDLKCSPCRIGKCRLRLNEAFVLDMYLRYCLHCNMPSRRNFRYLIRQPKMVITSAVGICEYR